MRSPLPISRGETGSRKLDHESGDGQPRTGHFQAGVDYKISSASSSIRPLRSARLRSSSESLGHRPSGSPAVLTRFFVTLSPNASLGFPGRVRVDKNVPFKELPKGV